MSLLATTRPRRRGSWLTIVGLVVAGAGGCAGSARLEFIPLAYRAVDPPAARTKPLYVDRCYWWTDDEQRVWISMERERAAPLARYGSFVLRLSLVLDKLPAGRARDYTLTTRSFRGVLRSPASESRFTSAAGITVLHRPVGDRLRGSFRLLGQRHVSRMLGDWSPPSSYLIQGTFEAVRDEARGRAIAADTESQGWTREAGGPVPGRPAKPTLPTTARAATQPGKLLTPSP